MSRIARYDRGHQNLLDRVASDAEQRVSIITACFRFRRMGSDNLSNKPGCDQLSSASGMVPTEYAQIYSTVGANRQLVIDLIVRA